MTSGCAGVPVSRGRGPPRYVHLRRAHESFRASLDFLGMPWAATIFGVPTADPILVASHAVTTRSFSLSLFVGLLIPFGLALMLGKVFCSHICPMRLLFELGQLIRGALLRFGAPLPHLRLESRFGGRVLLGGLIATLGAGTTVWFFLLPYVGVSASIFLARKGG